MVLDTLWRKLWRKLADTSLCFTICACHGNLNESSLVLIKTDRNDAAVKKAEALAVAYKVKTAAFKMDGKMSWLHS
jgi:hypothetical protein